MNIYSNFRHSDSYLNAFNIALPVFPAVRAAFEQLSRYSDLSMVYPGGLVSPKIFSARTTWTERTSHDVGFARYFSTSVHYVDYGAAFHWLEKGAYAPRLPVGYHAPLPFADECMDEAKTIFMLSWFTGAIAMRVDDVDFDLPPVDWPRELSMWHSGRIFVDQIYGESDSMCGLSSFPLSDLFDLMDDDIGSCTLTYFDLKVKHSSSVSTQTDIRWPHDSNEYFVTSVSTVAVSSDSSKEFV